MLGATADLPLADVVGADFFLAGLVAIAAALLVFWIIRRPNLKAAWYVLIPGAIVIAASAMTSHAAARLEYRPALVAADFLHQAAAGVWIGGIPYFLICLHLCRDDGRAFAAVCARFSQICLLAVAVLTLAGIGMGLVYVDSIAAIYGTAYGVMLAAKVAFFAMLLGLGFMNNRITARLQRDPAAPAYRLKRFAEVEIGIGLTVFFVAASFTSQPPAADLRDQRVTFAEIVSRMAPEIPTLSSPDLASLSLPQLQAKLDAEAARQAKPAAPAFVPGGGEPAPSNAADILWSEYNHHWSGLFVLAIGLLGIAEKSRHAHWARHWPLIFLALAAFLTIRSDPEVWPLGNIGLIESLKEADVLQHRIFVLLIIIFGLFEWGVRTGRIASRKAALVFPLMTAIGGALLMAHSHALANVRDELLVEVTHVPLAILGVVAGWARWLEIRLPPGERAAPGWTWCICFCLIGLLLLDYRESG